MSVTDRLAELGLVLPERRSAGSYVGAVRTGNLVYTAGAGPQRADGSLITGKVGSDVDVETATEAAKLCALGCLASLNEELGGLDGVKRIVKVLGMVNSAPGFVQQHVVMNGASDLLIALFGENGKHARSSVGMAELPMNIAVEIELVAEVA
jgi:enamine deaminase RidA (YjgF/YER057c/UK114 family)